MNRATMFEQAALGMIGGGSVLRRADAPDTEYILTHPEFRNGISREEVRKFLDRGWVHWSEPDSTGMCKLRWTEAGRKAYDGPTA